MYRRIACNGLPTGATQIYTNLSEGSSSSNQFQLTVDQRLSHGVQFRVASTLVAKTIDLFSGFRARSSTYTDPTNPLLDRSLADFDAPHGFVITSDIWDIPLGNHGNSFVRQSTRRLECSHDCQLPVTGESKRRFFRKNNSGELNYYLDRPDVAGPSWNFQHIRGRAGDSSPGANGDRNGVVLGGTEETGISLFQPHYTWFVRSVRW